MYVKYKSITFKAHNADCGTMKVTNNLAHLGCRDNSFFYTCQYLYEYTNPAPKRRVSMALGLIDSWLALPSRILPTEQFQ